MQHFTVTTSATARVEEQFVIDVPDGFDFDPQSWSSWTDVLTQGVGKVRYTRTTDVSDPDDRHERVVEGVRVGHVADVA